MKHMTVRMRMKKKICLGLMICGVAGAGMIWGLDLYPSQGLEGDKLIRLHVIANSDSPGDQRVKLLVRDEVIKLLTPSLQNAGSAEEARKEIRRQASSLEDAANRCLRVEKAGYQAAVQLGHFDFPAKSYGDLVLPEGNYEALRIVLGEGKGRNWWCVLFPPLCFVNIANSVVVDLREEAGSGDELKAVDGQPVQVEIRFRLIDWWKKLAQNSRPDLAESR